jgi:hypothetical protein
MTLKSYIRVEVDEADQTVKVFLSELIVVQVSLTGHGQFVGEAADGCEDFDWELSAKTVRPDDWNREYDVNPEPEVYTSVVGVNNSDGLVTAVLSYTK